MAPECSACAADLWFVLHHQDVRMLIFLTFRKSAARLRLIRQPGRTGRHQSRSRKVDGTLTRDMNQRCVDVTGTTDRIRSCAGAIPPVPRACTVGMSGGGCKQPTFTHVAHVVLRSVVMPLRHPGVKNLGYDMNIFRPCHPGWILPNAGPCTVTDSENGAQSHLEVLVMKGSIEACQCFRGVAVLDLLNSCLPDSFIRRLHEFCKSRNKGLGFIKARQAHFEFSVCACRFLVWV